jgi:hypothetical protein
LKFKAIEQKFITATINNVVSVKLITKRRWWGKKNYYIEAIGDGDADYRALRIHFQDKYVARGTYLKLQSDIGQKHLRLL